MLPFQEYGKYKRTIVQLYCGLKTKLNENLQCIENIHMNGFKILLLGFPGGSDGKESACNVGDLGLIPGSGRFPGEGNDNPLQYSCLENPMDRGAWWASGHGIAKSQTQLSDSHTHTHSHHSNPAIGSEVLN